MNSIKKIIDQFIKEQRALRGEQFFVDQRSSSDSKLEVTFFLNSQKEELIRRLKEVHLADQVIVGSIEDNKGEEVEVAKEPLSVYIAATKEKVANLADQLSSGEKVKLLTRGEEDTWTAIQIHHDFEDQVGKQFGWIKYHASNFKPAPEFKPNKHPRAFSEKQFLNEIQRFLAKHSNIKYVYAGKSKELGYDCSGFTQVVIFDLTGVRMPRISKLQAQLGKEVSKNELRPGDLVYFYSHSENRIRHIGLVYKVATSGNLFVHASSIANCITIDSLDNPKLINPDEDIAGFRRITDSYP